MAILTWDDSYSVNVKEIDRQHKKLFDMLNRLLEAMKERKGKEVVGSIIREMESYTVLHFGVEEGYMKQYEYPDYQQHKSEHEKFISKLASFKENLKSGKITLTMEVMQFLRDWLSNHILKTDKRYSAFFNEKGLT